ncbi:MAG: DUF3185 family protein [Gammaproteobacteria bacterium]|nr:DUF3185 family protein [Gammaproteobacteria bacterium]
MSEKKLIGFILIGVGAALLYMGYNASQSVGSQLRQAFSGSVSDRAMMFYVGGAVCAALGAFLALTTRR